MPLHLDFPFRFDGVGSTAQTKWTDHKRDMLFQFLLTFPGERVNRPDFGTPLSRSCFEGNSFQLSDVVQFVARAGVERWLGEVIEVIELRAEPHDAELRVELKYRVRGEAEVRMERRAIPLAGGRLA